MATPNAGSDTVAVAASVAVAGTEHCHRSFNRAVSRCCSLAWFPEHRPSGPPTAAQRRPIGVVAWVVDLTLCDHADGPPAACSLPGEPGRGAPPGGARQRNCAQRAALLGGRWGTMACPARPMEAPFPPTRSGLGPVLGAAADADVVPAAVSAPAAATADAVSGTERLCSAHLQMGVGAVERSRDADLEMGATIGRRLRKAQSARGMEQPPGEGSDGVEETDCRTGLRCVDSAGTDEETQVGVDLLRGAVGNSPVVDSIAA